MVVVSSMCLACAHVVPVCGCGEFNVFGVRACRALCKCLGLDVSGSDIGVCNVQHTLAAGILLKIV